MTIIVCKVFFSILCPYQQFQLLKTVVFWLEFTLSFSRNILDQTRKSWNTKFGPLRKDRKSSYHVRQILTLFGKLVTLIWGWNCVKYLRVTKIVKQIKFEGMWSELDAKNCFSRQSPTCSFSFYILIDSSNC